MSSFFFFFFLTLSRNELCSSRERSYRFVKWVSKEKTWSLQLALGSSVYYYYFFPLLLTAARAVREKKKKKRKKRRNESNSLLYCFYFLLPTARAVRENEEQVSCLFSTKGTVHCISKLLCILVRQQHCKRFHCHFVVLVHVACGL